MEFQLDSRLKDDTFFIGDLPLSKVLLMNIANFPWIILVPRINDVSEIFDLNIEHQQRYFEECNFLLKGMSELYLSNKMNIATLGNIVPQLHTHIIVRFTHDDAWPSPVWSHSENNQYNPEEAKLQIDKIGKLLDHYV